MENIAENIDTRSNTTQINIAETGSTEGKKMKRDTFVDHNCKQGFK